MLESPSTGRDDRQRLIHRQPTQFEFLPRVPSASSITRKGCSSTSPWSKYRTIWLWLIWTALTATCHAGFERINLHWHDLRHEYASRLVEHGVPLSKFATCWATPRSSRQNATTTSTSNGCSLPRANWNRASCSKRRPANQGRSFTFLAQNSSTAGENGFRVQDGGREQLSGESEGWGVAGCSGRVPQLVGPERCL